MQDFESSGETEKFKICPVCFRIINFIGDDPVGAFYTSFHKDSIVLIHNTCEITYYRALARKRNIPTLKRLVDETFIFFLKLRS